ncbi:MAG TPA: FKBP-type peptidyl-prolyl cis-trans isomerase [Jiangellaceae bacterium]|nr:FKBP-type peptidyl-prolyl cis-trans isomerase [Jiangellaceae bacterium]
MRRTPALAALLLATSLTLVACGSEGSGDSDDDVVSTESGIGVSGEFGDKPELDLPEGDPSADLVVEVLSEGDGDEVQAGDYLIANYLGQTWEPAEGGEANIFDNSYDRGEPAGFSIGNGAVIPGWDEGLVGKTTGSRVLLSIPPDQAYADSPPEGSTIEAGATLVFVVDIVETFGEDAGISGAPVAELPADMPTVSGEGADAPTVEFPDTATPVQASSADVVIEGDGGDLGERLVVKVVQASYTTKETQFSSWDEGAGPITMTPDQLPGLTEALDGHKVGTRAVVRIAAADNVTEESPDGEPILIVVDVIGSL